MQQEGWQQPDPPGVKPVRPFPLWRWIIAAIVVVGLAVAAVFVPIPIVYLYVPGPVRDAEDLIEITDSETFSSEGSLYMTTVSVDTSVSFVEMIVAGLDSAQQVVMKEDLTRGGTLQELRIEQRREMDLSQESARQVALSELGRDRPTGDGARVVTTITGAPADGVLLADDVIVSVDGHPTRTTCDVGSLIDAHETGDSVSITVERNGRERTFEIEVEQNPYDGSPAFVGIQMETVNFSFEPGVKVDFKTGQIAGPSAGLMLALALYDRLTPSDLTDGREIAGTGTLACDGSVGPIGGIQQKVAAARTRGAQIFLAPVGNYDEALEVAAGIEVVPIRTFDDALEYLQASG